MAITGRDMSNKTSEIMSDLINKISLLKESAPDLAGIVYLSKNTFTEEDAQPESWSLEIDNENQPKIVIDTGSSVLFLSKKEIEDMKAAISFIEELEPEKRNVAMVLLDRGLDD